MRLQGEKYTFLSIYEGDTPFPRLVRSIQGVFRRYAVRKGSVRSTQNPVISYAVFTLKRSTFHQETQKRDIQSQITLFYRTLASLALFGNHFSIYKLKR